MRIIPVLGALAFFTLGCPSNGNSDTSDGGPGSESNASDGMNGTRGAAGPKGDVGPAGPVGPKGDKGDPGGSSASASGATCEWCTVGENTIRYEAGRYIIYNCVAGAKSSGGCGDWATGKQCATGQSFSAGGVKDKLGFSSRTPGDVTYQCGAAVQSTGGDACTEDVDCKDAKKSCATQLGHMACVDRDSWLAGDGTWDYMSDHFAWPIYDYYIPPSVSCEWALSTYWQTASSQCTLSVYGNFDAPGGGLKWVSMSLQIDSSTPIGTPIANKLTLATDTNVTAHAGNVVTSTNQIVVTAMSLSKGGSVDGAWSIGGKVGADNVVQASGAFHVVLPLL